jgi:hypothetical protein
LGGDFDFAICNDVDDGFAREAFRIDVRPEPLRATMAIVAYSRFIPPKS